jgi:Flp pilus assembly protein TadD
MAAFFCATGVGAQKLPFPVEESRTPSNYTESPVKADIAGRVVAAAGYELPEKILVRLETHTGILLQRLWTGRGGNFQFSHIVCGFYVLAVDLPGYQPIRMAVEHSFIPAEGLRLRLVRSEEPSGEGGSAGEETLTTLNPLRDDAVKEFQKGLAKHADEKFDASIRHFRKAIELDPTLDEAHLQLALVYLQQRKPAEAQSVLEDATLRNPRNARTLALLGRAYRLQSQWDKAAASLSRAVEIKDDFWIAQLELGQALVALGRVDEAFPHVRRAHELNPTEASTHQTYYNTLIRRSDYRAALEELDEFLRLFPRHSLAEKARAQREALSKEVARTARN